MSELIKVRVSSRLKEGHRRIGRFIPNHEIELDVTSQQLAALQADGMISIVTISGIETAIGLFGDDPKRDHNRAAQLEQQLANLRKELSDAKSALAQRDAEITKSKDELANLRKELSDAKSKDKSGK